MTVNESIKLGLKIFKKILGDAFDISRFDAGYILDKELKLKKIKGDKLKKYLK